MTSKDFRQRALDMLWGRWGIAILTTFVASIFGALVTNTGTSFNFDMDQQVWDKLPEIVKTYFTVAISTGSVLSLVVFILGGTVRLGYCKFLLKLHDGKDADIKDLFSEFGRFREGFLLSLLTAIYTFLWTLLFIIPGIIAVYKYAMAPFILQENKEMTAKEAITASKELMDGHKFELFCLGLSFIGWAFLCLLTLGIGALWLYPYENAAYAAFYRNLSPAGTAYVPQAPAPEGGNPWDQIIQ